MYKMDTKFKQFIRDKLQVVHGLFVSVEDFTEEDMKQLNELHEEETNSKEIGDEL